MTMTDQIAKRVNKIKEKIIYQMETFHQHGIEPSMIYLNKDDYHDLLIEAYSGCGYQAPYLNMSNDEVYLFGVKVSQDWIEEPTVMEERVVEQLDDSKEFIDIITIKRRLR
jgi:hypothetical protein